MKRNTSKAAADIENEELQKLADALKTIQQIEKEKLEYGEFLSGARNEVDEFALRGDLRNTEQVSLILVRQAQVNFGERRLANIDERLGVAERALDEENAAVQRLIETALNQLQNGLAEKAAREMKEHFADFQDARRQGLKSKQAGEVNDRIHSLRYVPHTLDGDSIAIAKEYLALAPRVFAEVEQIKKSLGGAIPSLSELHAL
jgi:hypothetical protein